MRCTYIFILLTSYNIYAQFPAPNLILMKDYSQSLEKELYFGEKKVNTSFKPIIKSNLSESFYSKFLENKELDQKYIKRVFTNGLFILKGPSSLEKNSQINFDIFEGSSDPIDLISIKQHGSFVPEKYICSESVNLTITNFSGLFRREEIKSELFDKNICSFLISLLVEIFNKGTLVNK